jgi:hypothetical protein
VPWPFAAAGLLAVLALMIGLGAASNALRRPQALLATQTPTVAPQVVIIPTSLPTPEAALTRALTVAATAVRTQPTVTSRSSRTGTTEIEGLSAKTQVPHGQAANVATAQVDTGATMAAEVAESGNLQPTAAPAVDSNLAAEVVPAYKHYWDVRADALLNLDPTHLPEVSAGPHLTVLQNGIEQLKNEGYAIRTDVQLNFKVVSATSNLAIVADDFVDSSVYVDPETKELIGDKNADNSFTTQSKVEFKMQKFGDTWKVVDSADAP